MKIVFLVAAQDHLENIYSQISIKSEQAATNLYNHFLDEIERLKDFPQMAAIEALLENESQTFRSLVVQPNYKVIYFIENEIVYIAAIWDCRQNPRALKKTLK